MPTVEFAVAAAVLVLAVLWAAVLLYSADQQAERGLLSLASPDAPEIAFRSVVHARSRFTRAVQDYEQALVRGSQMAELGTVAPPDLVAPDRIEDLEQSKVDARSRLLEAQRAWESVQPKPGPASPQNLWIGTGVLRGWQLGPFGREMLIVRFEHAHDPDCWVVWGMRRHRVGLGLGAESQRLCLHADRCAAGQLEDLVSAAFAGAELALRPGFAPFRRLRHRLDRRGIRDATRQALHEAGSARTLVNGPRRETVDALAAAIHRSRSGRPAVDRVRLSIRAAGPTWCIGFWVGRRPACHVLARSNHRPWRVRSAADG